MIYNSTEYEVVSRNEDYAVLRNGKTLIAVSTADLAKEKEEDKPSKRQRTSRA